MEYRDMLKDEIEQVLKVMTKILSDITGVGSNGQYSATIETSTQQLKNELDLDVEFMLGLTFEELVDYVVAVKLSEDMLVTLADIFQELGNGAISNNTAKTKLYLEKSYELLKIANRSSKVFSINRMDKINKISDLIEAL